MRLIDVRAGRFEQAILVVILLGGFAFAVSWSIPTAAAIAAIGAVFGERSPLIRVWNELIARRVAAARSFEAANVARLQSLLIAAGLAVATGLLILGSVALASITAAVVAIVAALGAAGIVSLAAEIRHRADRRPRR